jgi:excisionase family DNA binding protein
MLRGTRGIIEMSTSSELAASATFEPLLTAEEAAGHLRIHVKTVQKMAREGVIPCLRMGKYWRFRLSTLDQWVSSQQELGQPTATA